MSMSPIGDLYLVRHVLNFPNNSQMCSIKWSRTRQSMPRCCFGRRGDTNFELVFDL